MENSNMPAMPLVNSNGHPFFERDVCFDAGNLTSGLTKREHFAGLAMQAYLTGNLSWSDGLDGGSVSPCAEEVATEAVSYADALLEELERAND